MNLYEIDESIKRILDNGFNGTINEETGEVEEMGEQDLEALEMLRSEKLEAIALYIKNAESIAAQIKAEETALSERRKAHEAKVSRLKDYLAESMTRAGENGFETGKVKIGFRKSFGVVFDERKLTDEFFTVKTERKPSATLIRAAIKAGKNVDGAYLEERRNIQIV